MPGQGKPRRRLAQQLLGHLRQAAGRAVVDHAARRGMRDQGDQWRPNRLIAHEAGNEQEGFWWVIVLAQKLNLQNQVNLPHCQLKMQRTLPRRPCCLNDPQKRTVIPI
jgi:hypothetical protein